MIKMMNREENVKKIVESVEKIFAEKEIEIPSEILPQINEKINEEISTLSDEQLEKVASEEILQKINDELEKVLSAENFAEIRDLSDDEMEQVAGGGFWSDLWNKIKTAVVDTLKKKIFGDV